MWTNVRGHHRLAAIHKEDYPRPSSSSQQYPQGRDRRYTCLDSQVFYTRGVGEETGWRMIMRNTCHFVICANLDHFPAEKVRRHYTPSTLDDTSFRRVLDIMYKRKWNE